MGKRTKKQHYIAQCLLRIFVDGNDIYECITTTNRAYETSFENSMCRKDSYESSFFVDNHLEKFFADYIDGDTANLNRKIILMLNDDSCDLGQVYSTFLDNLHLYLVNYYKSITSLVRFSTKDSDIGDYSITTMLSRILNENYIKRLCMIFRKGYKFSIIKSEKGDFILCDQYLASCSTKYKGMYSNISSRDIGIRDTIILFPLNCYFYVIFYDNEINDFDLVEDKINCLNEEQVKQINNIIYSNAYQKVVSSKKDNLDNLEKQNSSFGDATAMIVYKDGHSISHRVKSEIFFNKEQVEFYKYYQTLEWGNPTYKKCKVNSKCPCGSNIKYKKCCKNKIDECLRIFNNQQLNRNILINEGLGMEEPVRMPGYVGQEIRELVQKERSKQ